MPTKALNFLELSKFLKVFQFLLISLCRFVVAVSNEVFKPPFRTVKLQIDAVNHQDDLVGKTTDDSNLDSFYTYSPGSNECVQSPGSRFVFFV